MRTLRHAWTRLAVLALTAWAGLAAAEPSTEMAAGSNDVTTTTPTLAPLMATMLANANNPTGSTFTDVTGIQPTVSITVINQALYATSSNFATHGVYVGDGEGTSPRLSLMNAVGAGSNAQFTSLPPPLVTAGTGIDVAANRGFMIEAQTAGLATAAAARLGRIHVADISLALNVPMSNVVLHLTGLGGTAGGKTFAAEFDLIPASSIGATGLLRLSGNSALVVSGDRITSNVTAPGSSCSTAPLAACGSVQVQGTAIRQIALRIYLRSSDTLDWPTEPANGVRPADAFVLALSGEVADARPDLSSIPATFLMGETTRGLTASCVNDGPNTARNPTCALSASAGSVSNLTCATASALASGGALGCTFDYTAPAYGSGVANVTFTATTGASNDRHGGTTTAGNNTATTSLISIQGTPFAPAQPSATCSTVVERLAFSFAAVAGGTESGSYDLVSHSPMSYDVNGRPVLVVGSGTVSTQTFATSPGALFQPVELASAALPTTATTGTGEVAIVTSRVVGRPGSAMTVRVADGGHADHDAFTIETAGGTMIARTPASGSNSTDGELTLAFIMPAQGYVFLRQYIADYAASYGQRLDGGCLRTNLVTVKSRSSASPIEAGKTVTFTITVSNAGPSDASNILLTDLVPPSLSSVSTLVPAGTSYTAATGLWTVGDLASGASATLTLTATAGPEASGTTVTNTTTAAAGDQIDPTTAADVLQASVTVLQAAQVSATKTVTLLSNSAANCAGRSSTPDSGAVAFLPGSCVEFLIRLTNPTTGTAHNIRLTDVLVAGLTFLGANATGFDDSDPGYGLNIPAIPTTCGGTACTIRLDEARLPAATSGQVRIRALLQ